MRVPYLTPSAICFVGFSVGVQGLGGSFKRVFIHI
jgi:hypothetical protein